MNVLQLREISAYERKIAELREERDLEVERLSQAQIGRETADQEAKKFWIQVRNLESQIMAKKNELSALETTVEGRRKEDKRLAKDSQSARGELIIQIEGIRFQLKGYKMQIENAEKKKKTLAPIVKKYDSLVSEISKLEKKRDKLYSEITINKKKAADIIVKAKDILARAKIKSDGVDERFRSVQKFETGVMFYYERMRKWYQDKGLTLPKELIYKL